jgi:hypothetical protein
VQVDTQLVGAVASQLKAKVLAAFPDRACSDWEAMLLARYRPSDDAIEMAMEFAGQGWRTISRYRLFYHREMLFALTAEAFRVYLPAYLLACLEPSDRYLGDLLGYTINVLGGETAELIERTRMLDDTQRRVTTDVISYIALWSGSEDAWKALETWRR